MTISAASRTQFYAGSGSSGPFGFNFPVTDSSQIGVQKVDAVGNIVGLAAGVDYSVSLLAGGGNGGNVTLTTTLPLGSTLLIYGSTPLTQETPFNDQGTFRPETHGAAFDKLTRIVQELKQAILHAVHFPLVDGDTFDSELPARSTRAGKAVIFDSVGDITVSNAPYGEADAAAAAAAAAAALVSENNSAANATAAAASVAAISDQRYAVAGGTANALTLTYSPAVVAYTDGMVFRFKVTQANTASPTLNINGLGARVLRKNFSDVVNAGDLKVGQMLMVMYDATNSRFQILAAIPVAYPVDEITMTLMAANFGQ